MTGQPVSDVDNVANPSRLYGARFTDARSVAIISSD
jgi:hypothetical protein